MYRFCHRERETALKSFAVFRMALWSPGVSRRLKTGFSTLEIADNLFLWPLRVLFDGVTLLGQLPVAGQPIQRRRSWFDFDWQIG